MLYLARVAVAGVCGLALASGCTPRPVQPTWEDIPIVQIVDQAPAEWKLDPFTLEDVAVDGDSVLVTITYGGGCTEHTFALFMTPAIIKTNPAQVELYLRHNGHGDACWALITATVGFDITPIQAHVAPHYGGAAKDVLLDLYRFEQSAFVQVPYLAE